MGKGKLSSPKTSSPTVKLVDIKAATEEKMTIVGARIGEKVVHLRANFALGLYRVARHVEPGCVDHVAEKMTAASERRLRKEQEAKDRAEWERAMVREWSLQKSSRHMDHHSHDFQQPLLVA